MFSNKIDPLIMEDKRKRADSQNSALWRAALDRYERTFLDVRDYDEVMENNSYENLIREAESMKSLFSGDRGTLDCAQRLKPTLSSIDDFSAVLALCFGADAKFTVIVWGSIRVMLSMAASRGDTIDKVISMLEELGQTLPKIKAYEDSKFMNPALEAMVIDVYTEVICFYARCVRFFRMESRRLIRPRAWETLCEDFTKTIQAVKGLANSINYRVELAMMEESKKGEKKYSELLEVVASLQKTKIKDDEATNVCNLPENLDTPFWGRDSLVEDIERVLEPGVKPPQLKSFALYGMGGIGKTKIAYHYARLHKSKYDAVLWIASDNYIKLCQSFKEIEALLWPGEVNEGQDTASAVLKVKNWLCSTGKQWLLIFDNADDNEVLRHAWPANGQGSIIITTRDCNTASLRTPDRQSREQVRPFDDSTGIKVLLNILEIDTDNALAQESAKSIIEAVGGLPLALNQIGSFIKNSGIPIDEFLEEFRDDLLEISEREKNADCYKYTINSVWHRSMARISYNARSLLDLLAYFQPDAINVKVLVQGSSATSFDVLTFLQNKWRKVNNQQLPLMLMLIITYSRRDTMNELHQNSLIQKSSTLVDGVLSVHRLMQAVVINNHSSTYRSKCFDTVVQVLSCGFPERWSEDTGHQIETWSNCEKCLPHVHHLVTLREKFEIKVSNPQKYSELLLRCSWYLYEREYYDIAKFMVDAALDNFVDKTTLAFATAVELSGLIIMDMNNHYEALHRFKEALKICEKLVEPKDPIIASHLVNVALAYTEMGNLLGAYEAHNLAIDIRLKNGSSRIGNSYSNMSSLLLRMGNAEEAEEMLKRCPSLKEFTDETFIKTGNPRFSGDMVLLSRIRYAQGRLDEALRLSSKALLFRQSLLGNRLKTCDSLYDVAFFTHRQGNPASAMELLNRLIDIASSLPEGKGQLARAYFKVGDIHEEAQRVIEASAYFDKASKLRAELKPELANDSITEESFAKLCLWMLW